MDHYDPKKQKENVRNIVRREMCFGSLLLISGLHAVFWAINVHNDPQFGDKLRNPLCIDKWDGTTTPFLWAIIGAVLTFLGLVTIFSSILLSIGVKKRSLTLFKTWWGIYSVLVCMTALRTALLLAYAENVPSWILIIGHMVYMVVHLESLNVAKKYAAELKRDATKDLEDPNNKLDQEKFLAA